MYARPTALRFGLTVLPLSFGSNKDARLSSGKESKSSRAVTGLLASSFAKANSVLGVMRGR